MRNSSSRSNNGGHTDHVDHQWHQHDCSSYTGERQIAPLLYGWQRGADVTENVQRRSSNVFHAVEQVRSTSSSFHQHQQQQHQIHHDYHFFQHPHCHGLQEPIGTTSYTQHKNGEAAVNIFNTHLGLPTPVGPLALNFVGTSQALLTHRELVPSPLMMPTDIPLSSLSRISSLRYECKNIIGMEVLGRAHGQSFLNPSSGNYSQPQEGERLAELAYHNRREDGNSDEAGGTGKEGNFARISSIPGGGRESVESHSMCNTTRQNVHYPQQERQQQQERESDSRSSASSAWNLALNVAPSDCLHLAYPLPHPLRGLRTKVNGRGGIDACSHNDHYRESPSDIISSHQRERMTTTGITVPSSSTEAPRISEEGNVPPITGVGRTEWGKYPQPPQTNYKEVTQVSSKVIQGTMTLSSEGLPLSTPSIRSSEQSIEQMTVGANETVMYSLLPPQRPEHVGRSTCCLDLDDTLVHTFLKRPDWWDPVHNPLHFVIVLNATPSTEGGNDALISSNFTDNGGDSSTPLTYFASSVSPSDQEGSDTGLHSGITLSPNCPQQLPRREEQETGVQLQYRDILYVCIRPYAEELVRSCLRYFEVVFFTTGTEDYGHPIFDRLDPEHATYRLYRQHCTRVGENNYKKDLSLLGRPLDRVILFDDRGPDVSFQANNVLFCEPFVLEDVDNIYDRVTNDNDLRGYIPLLETLGRLPGPIMLTALFEYQTVMRSRMEMELQLHLDQDSGATADSLRTQ